MTKRSRAPIRVIWDNPPGPKQGLTLEYEGGAEMYIPPNGLLSVNETALALDVTARRVYQLIDGGDLQVRGSGVRRIPVSAVRRLLPHGGRFFVG